MNWSSALRSLRKSRGSNEATSIKRRVDELERRTGNNDFLCLVRFDDETPEQALERELAEGNITERDRAYSYILVMSERDARL
jgi:hypothetical protein